MPRIRPACTAIQPFYWEIGDRSAALASGSAGTPTVQAGTVLQIASASKWLHGAYVVQKRGAALDETDRKYLRFQRGCTSFDFCDRDQTVAECAAAGTNAVYTAAEYAQVLRRMPTGELLIGSLLGNGAVCAAPSVCPGAGARLAGTAP